MLSGAPILLLIVALWAAYLVPMFLTRYDRATESRSVDRFAGAMRSLGRREPGRSAARAGSREVLMPARPVTGPTRTARAPGAVASRGDRSALVARRRRVVLTLVSSAVVLGLAALLGLPGALALHLLADLLLLGYVGVLRHQQLRAAEADDDQRRVAVEHDRRRASAAPRRTPMDSWLPRRMPSRATLAGAVRPVPVATPEPVAEPVRRPAPLVVEFDLEMDTVAAAEPARATGTGGAWSPVPVPPPVYTTKPAAPGRVVDLTVPGAWTAAHVLADLGHDGSGLERTAASDSVDELDAVLEHRWAVND